MQECELEQGDQVRRIDPEDSVPVQGHLRTASLCVRGLYGRLSDVVHDQFELLLVDELVDVHDLQAWLQMHTLQVGLHEGFQRGR